MTELTHLDAAGQARMVDVSGKPVTATSPPTALAPPLLPIVILSLFDRLLETMFPPPIGQLSITKNYGPSSLVGGEGCRSEKPSRTSCKR